MQRLEKAALTKNTSILREAVQREMLFKAKLHLPMEPACDLPDVDPLAAEVIDGFVDDINGNPITTSGNGDCLFNAVSIHLCGNETLSTRLRYHTCLNLVNNMADYMRHPLRPRIQQLSCSYESACLAAAKTGCFSSSWTILALSDTIAMPIRIIYPFANGKNDAAYQSLNTVFTHEKNNGHELAVLWHGLGRVPVKGQWYPVNHFSAVTDTVSLTPKSSTPMNADQRKTVFKSPQPEVSEIEQKTSPWRTPCKRRKISPNSTVRSEENIVKTANRFGVLSDSETEMDTGDVGDADCDSFRQMNDDNIGINHVNKVDVNEAHDRVPVHNPRMKQLPSSRFLSNTEVFDILMHTESYEYKIPKGKKGNVYMVMKCSENNGARMEFVDDCGVWVSGTTVNQYFAVNNNNTVRNVYKKDGLFCHKKVTNKKLEFIHLHPQPEDIIVLHRYYAQLKGENLRRRISVVSDASERLQYLKMKCIIEYLGHVSNAIRPPHGNAKTGDSYKRTAPTVIRAAAEKVGVKSATQVVTQMAVDDSVLSPKTARQVQDRLHYERKKQSKPQNSLPRKNIADELLSIIGKINENDFVQEIVITKNKDPIVILYHQSQIDDMRKNCLGTHGSVIGVDRTFNLARFFVTAMTYKNRSVISRKTNQFPVLLGPLCLQWDGEQSSYQKFCNHVREKLGSDHFTFGTDDEKAMRSALAICFSRADFLLCTKHLKDNIRHHLQKKGTDEKTRQAIISSIFGEDGLVFSDDDFEFAQREDNLSVFFNQHPHFRSYYERYLADKLREYVYKPLKEKKITKLWTNNNAESMNNRLKQETQHKILSAPQLIEKLSSVAQGHLVDLRRALYGSGNYKLFGYSRKFLIDEHIWHDKSSEEKKRHFKKFLSVPLPSDANNGFVQSATGEIKCKKPRQNAGKKPGQRKRPAAERAVDVKHR